MEMGPATCYTLRRNIASIMKVLISFFEPILFKVLSVDAKYLNIPFQIIPVFLIYQ